MKVINTPWEDLLVDLVASSRNRIYLSSPYIKTNIAKLIIDNKRKNEEIDCKLLTRFTLPNVRNGGLDLLALKQFAKADFSQKNISNLHAKVFIFDNNAVVTSANLTNGGLKNNLEYGLLLDDANLIANDFLKYFNNSDYEFIKNKHISKVESFIKALLKPNKNIIILSDEGSIFTEDLDVIRSELSNGNKIVLDCIDRLNKDIFSSSDIYKFRDVFAGKTPENTIRRNLQELRDFGLLEFISHGVYKKLWK